MVQQFNMETFKTLILDLIGNNTFLSSTKFAGISCIYSAILLAIFDETNPNISELLWGGLTALGVARVLTNKQ